MQLHNNNFVYLSSSTWTYKVFQQWPSISGQFKDAFWVGIFSKVRTCPLIDEQVNKCIYQLSLANQYIDLARAKSEALDNFYSLLKQNIKSYNAKR